MKRMRPRSPALCPICGKIPFTPRNMRSSRVFVGDGGQYRSRLGARGGNPRNKIGYCWHNQAHPSVLAAARSAQLNKARKGATRRGDKRRPGKP